MPPSKSAEDYCDLPGCKGIISAVNWISCDDCEGWFHYPCVKVTAKDAENDYKCPACCLKATPKPSEDYFIGLDDYYQCSVAALAELRIPECYSKTQAGLAKLISALDKSLISTTLTIIRSHFKKKSAANQSWLVILGLRRDDNFMEQIQQLIFGSSNLVDFCQMDSHVAHRYISILFRKMFAFMLEKKKSIVHPNSSTPKPLTDIEAQGFRYVAGSVVRKALNHIKNKLSDLEFSTLYNALVKKTSDRHETETFTAGIDRGGLLYIKDECYNYFVELDKTIDMYYSNLDCQKRLELAMDAVNQNKLLQVIWEIRLGLDSRYQIALQTIIETTLTHRGNVFRRQLEEDNNIKISAKKKFKGDVALRDKLQK